MKDAEQHELIADIIARELDPSPHAEPSEIAKNKARSIVETLYWRGVNLELPDWFYDDNTEDEDGFDRYGDKDARYGF